MDYTDQFYSRRDQSTRYSARTILNLVLNQVPDITSATDIGCGVGTWLSVLKEEFNCKDVLGIEGPWVSKSSLLLDPDEFKEIDITTQDINLSKNYDLSICLEVAEHLPESSAYNLVESICGISNYALFSAAVPGQPGVNHINCQWPEYWENLFLEHGFVALDVIRSKIWDDEKIPYWYSQNTILYGKIAKLDELGIGTESFDTAVPAQVHPKLYNYHRQPYLKRKFREFVKQKSTSG